MFCVCSKSGFNCIAPVLTALQQHYNQHNKKAVPKQHAPDRGNPTDTCCELTTAPAAVGNVVQVEVQLTQPRRIDALDPAHCSYNQVCQLLY
jgi:hypothetical protein